MYCREEQKNTLKFGDSSPRGVQRFSLKNYFLFSFERDCCTPWIVLRTVVTRATTDCFGCTREQDGRRVINSSKALALAPSACAIASFFSRVWWISSVKRESSPFSSRLRCPIRTGKILKPARQIVPPPYQYRCQLRGIRKLQKRAKKKELWMRNHRDVNMFCWPKHRRFVKRQIIRITFLFPRCQTTRSVHFHTLR